jgi:hypothetical protein
VAAALAHGDHGEAAARRLRSDPGPRDRQRRVEGAARQVRQLRGDVVDGHVVGEVPAGQAKQEPPVLHPQRVDRLPVRQRADRLRRVRIGADGGDEAGAHGVRRRPGRAQRRVRELVPVAGMSHQVVAEGGTHPEHAEQPHRGALVVDQGLEQHLAVGGGRGQPDQGVQREVGVCGLGEQRHQGTGGRAQGVQPGGGAVAVLEAGPDEVARRQQ